VFERGNEFTNLSDLTTGQKVSVRGCGCGAHLLLGLVLHVGGVLYEGRSAVLQLRLAAGQVAHRLRHGDVRGEAAAPADPVDPAGGGGGGGG